MPDADAPAGEVFGRTRDHEQVTFFQDAAVGLRAVVAIYSTALGPALGGTRFHAYPDEDAAVKDVLDLARGMAYKNALAGLDHGGGKAVIIGDPRTAKTPELLRAYGRCVEWLGGRYITACDVGTYVADMDIVAETCHHVTGRSPERGGAGDSSVLTALGVFQGMRAAAEYRWGSPDLAGRRVGVAGVGKVGHLLVGHLLDAGAAVLVTDVDAEAVRRVTGRYADAAGRGRVEVVADADALVRADIDVYAPCALGGALDDATVAVLRAGIVCGAANNQLAHPGVGKLLADRGILYAPDYLVNAGGVIQVAEEARGSGFDFERARRRAEGIYATTRRILAAADAEGVPPEVAADRLAEQRMQQAAPGCSSG